MTHRISIKPGGLPRAPGTLPHLGKPPKVDVQRHEDAWTIARRREYAARILEDTFRRGLRVLIVSEDGPAVDGDKHPACIVLSTAGQVIHWRGSGQRPTFSPAPHLIADALASYVVARFHITNLYLEGPTAWHPFPEHPSRGGKDRRHIA